MTNAELEAILGARHEAEAWRNLAWVMANGVLMWDQVSEEDKAVIREQAQRLTPDLLRLSWEERTPEGTSPQWAVNLIAAARAKPDRYSTKEFFGID